MAFIELMNEDFGRILMYVSIEMRRAIDTAGPVMIVVIGAA